jgi:hypothetical protein
MDMKVRGKIIVAGVIITALILLPCLGIAGSLEPSGPPEPTMKTLDQIPPTWSQKLPSSERFVIVLDGAGVLDKETGLVWEQSPSTNFVYPPFGDNCAVLNKGGRKGWRLPTVQELASLVDPTQADPSLPSGHPFSNVLSGCYWCATTDAIDPSSGQYVVCFNEGDIWFAARSQSGIHAWCVRGGQVIIPR